MKDWDSLIRTINDFPSPGIVFRDITPLIQNGEALSEVCHTLSQSDAEATLIAGVEARGFIFATGAAILSGRGIIPVRKKGKLPYETLEEDYGLEYGSDVIQIHVDAIKNTEQVLLVDDVLATGGTLVAAIRLLQRGGAIVKTVAVLLEIESLNGRSRLLSEFPDLNVVSLLKG